MPRILTPIDVADFRNRLCDVASDLFAETGQAGFNMRELAKRLGVSAMTPYRYFIDKNAILSEVRGRAFARFADWLEEQSAFAGNGGDALPRAYAHFAIQQQTQYRLMFDLTQPQTAGPPTVSQQERRARDAINFYVRDLVERKVLAGDPELLGLVLWSTLHGVATLYLAGKLSSREFDLVLSQTVRAFAENPADAQPSQSRPDGTPTQTMTAQCAAAIMAG